MNKVYLVNLVVSGKSDHPMNTKVFIDAMDAILYSYNMLLDVDQMSEEDLYRITYTQASILKNVGSTVVTCNNKNVLINEHKVS